MQLEHGQTVDLPSVPEPAGGFEPINLDDISNDHQEMDHIGRVLIKLGLYAEAKGRAIYYRQEGEIDAAFRAEAECQGIYRRLPAWAKW